MIKVHTYPPFYCNCDPDIAFVDPLMIIAVNAHQMDLGKGIRLCTKLLLHGSAEPMYVAETPEEIKGLIDVNEATMSGVDRPMAYPGSLKDPEDPVVLSKETHKNGTEVSRTADGRTGVLFHGAELIFTDDLQESPENNPVEDCDAEVILNKLLDGDFTVDEKPGLGEPFSEATQEEYEEAVHHCRVWPESKTSTPSEPPRECTDDSDSQPWGEMTQEEVDEEAAWEAASDKCSEGEDDEEDWDELYDELDDLDFPESHDPSTPTTDAT